MAQITVYTTEPCSFCIRVKQLLAAPKGTTEYDLFCPKG